MPPHRLAASAWLVCASVMLAATAAGAQDADASTAGAAAEADPSLDAGAGSSVPAADPDADARHAEALARFDDAAALFERGDSAGALAEMELVYRLLEGRDDQYVVFYNLGRIYEALHRYDRAVELYERYLRDSPPDGEDRADAEASLRALERLLATIAIDVTAEDVAVEVWIGDALVGEAPGEIRIPAGAHTLEVRAAGYETHREEIEVAARTRLELHVTLARLSDVHGVSPAFFATTSAAALAALAVGIGLGVHAQDLGAAASRCAPPARDCPLSFDPDAESRRIADVALAADVLFGTAALFAVTSVVLAFLTEWGGRPSPRADAASAFLLSPSFGPSGAGLVVAGRL